MRLAAVILPDLGTGPDVPIVVSHWFAARGDTGLGRGAAGGSPGRARHVRRSLAGFRPFGRDPRSGKTIESRRVRFSVWSPRPRTMRAKAALTKSADSPAR